MLKSAVIVMTVMGCSDDASQCEFIEQPQMEWETTEACEAATTDALRRYDDANYPVVVAHCAPGEDLLADSETAPASKTPETKLVENDADGGEPESLFDQAGVPLGVVEQPDDSKRILVRLKDGVVSIRRGANDVLTRFADNTRNGIANLVRGVRKLITPKMQQE